MRISVYLLILLILLPLTILNGTVFDFLNVGVSARSNAMAGSFSAISSDVNSLQWNPAGLQGIEKGILSTSLLLYVADIKLGDVHYGFKKGGNTFAFALNYVNYGSMEKKDVNNQGTGTFTPMDLVFTFGLSRSITEELTAGGAMKFIYESIDSFVSMGAGADIGFQYLMRERNLTLALSLKNLGAQLKTHNKESGSFPMSITGGGSFHPVKTFSLNLDVTRIFSDSRTIVSLGGEWWAIPMFALRAGYSNAGTELKTGYGSDMLAGTSAGIGLSWKNIYVDYAIQPMGELGLSNSISLSHSF
jgi:hypothetical protein